jgi:hypothetical protein
VALLRVLLIATPHVLAADGAAPRSPGRKAVSRGQSAVAGAHRKQASSRAHATTIKLCAFAAGAHVVIDTVQPVLGAVSDLQDMLGLALLAVLECHADPGWASVTPG